MRRKHSAAIALGLIICSVMLPILSVKAKATGAFAMYAVRYSAGIFGMSITEKDGALSRATDERDIDFTPFTSGVWLSPSDMPSVTEKSASVSCDTVTVDFSAKPVDIMWCHELTARINVKSAGDTSVSLAIATTKSAYEATATVEASTDYLLVASLAEIPDGERLISLTFTASGASAITLTELFADNRTTVDFIKKYLAADFTCIGGNTSTEYGKVVLSPSDSDELTLNVSSAVLRTGDSTDYLAVKLSSATSLDSLTLAVGSTLYGTVTLRSGTADYYFALPAKTASSYSLIFDCDSSRSAYEIESVSVLSLENPKKFVTESVGKVSDVKIVKSPMSLSISGSITSSAVVKYIDRKIAVYEYPIGTEVGEIRDIEPIETFDISTQFSVTLPTDKYTLSPESSVYAVAILTEQGPVFLSEPRCVSSKASAYTSDGSVVGLAGATTLGIFESNAAHAVFDIDFARLDGEYLKTLDKAVEFCVSANVSVYLRFYSSENLSGYGYTTSEAIDGMYPFAVTNKSGIEYFTDTLSSIVKRYPSAVGYVYKVPANTERTEYGFGKLYAETITAARNVLTVSMSNAVIFASLDENGAGAAGVADIVLSHFTDASYGIAWCGTANGHTAFVSSLSEKTASPQASTLLFVYPTEELAEDIVLSFADTAEYANDNDIDAVFLVIPDALTESDIYSKISAKLNLLESARYTYELSLAEKKDYTGEVTVFDYSSAYSTAGWISGDGCASIATELHPYLGNKRSLEASFDITEAGLHAGGVLIYHPTNTMHLSSADTFRGVLYAATEADSISLKLIFSYGDIRYEYTTEIEANTPTALDFDTHEISESLKLDYIALSVRSDESVKLNLYSATALSTHYTDDELSSAVFPKQADEHTESHDDTRQNLITVICASTFALSTVVFLILSKRKKEQ